MWTHPPPPPPPPPGPWQRKLNNPNSFICRTAIARGNLYCQSVRKKKNQFLGDLNMFPVCFRIVFEVRQPWDGRCRNPGRSGLNTFICCSSEYWFNKPRALFSFGFHFFGWLIFVYGFCLGLAWRCAVEVRCVTAAVAASPPFPSASAGESSENPSRLFGIVPIRPSCNNGRHGRRVNGWVGGWLEGKGGEGRLQLPSGPLPWGREGL